MGHVPAEGKVRSKLRLTWDRVSRDGFYARPVVHYPNLGNKLIEWHSLVSKLVDVNLNEGMNLLLWNHHKNGLLTVKSMYEHLVNNNIKGTQEIWRRKISLKIKILMWYVKRGVILTK